MLKPGTLVGSGLESGSMARAIEDAMVAQGVLNLGDETDDAAEMRRKAFIAIATGVVTHLKAALEVKLAAGKVSTSLPAADVLLRGQDGAIS
jgi:hypothetical protein